MTGEAAVIAARLASASEVFPLARQDDWDGTVRVAADGDALLVTVTDHMGRNQREYHARLVLVTETTPAAVCGENGP